MLKVTAHLPLAIELFLTSFHNQSRSATSSGKKAAADSTPSASKLMTELENARMYLTAIRLCIRGQEVSIRPGFSSNAEMKFDEADIAAMHRLLESQLSKVTASLICEFVHFSVFVL